MLKRILGEIAMLVLMIELSYFLLLFLSGFSVEFRLGFVGILLIAFSLIIRKFK